MAAAAALAPARTARAAELEVEGELGAGADSNPERVLGEGRRGAAFALALVGLEATGSAGRIGLRLRLDEAARLYPSRSSADAIASRLEAGAQLPLPHGLTAAIDVSARELTERAGALDLASGRATASVAWRSGAFSASAAGGYAAFAPRAPVLRAFEELGPSAALRVAFDAAPAHRLAVGYEAWWARYDRWGELAAGERSDLAQTASAEWTFRGDVVGAVGYAHTWNGSTAPGGDSTRHRVTASAAMLLPLDVTLAARAALQWSSYAAPIPLPQQLLLAAGQELQDAVEARLSRPLAGEVEIAVALAWYQSETSLGGGPVPGYARLVASASLAWRRSWPPPP